MNFFQSEVVQRELTQMQDIYMDINRMGLMLNVSQKREQLDKMLRLIELQQTMYMRVILSDDPEAKKTLDDLKRSIALFGYGEDVDMNLFFDAVHKTIQSLRVNID